MPLFSKKEKKSIKSDNSSFSEEDEEKIKKIQDDSRAQKMAKQLSFNAQLAHGSPTVKISNFSNVKELYQKIADALNITEQDVCILLLLLVLYFDYYFSY